MAPVKTAVSAYAVRTADPDARLAQDASSILVHSLLSQAEESVRRESLGEFYKANHSKAVVFARTFLNREDEAQDAVGRTYLKLLSGKTTERHFFRALKQTCLDRIRALKREDKLFAPPKEHVSPELLGLSGCAWGSGDETACEPVSEALDDQDPLDILVRREESAQCQAMVRRAMTDPRWRFVKRKKWARPLVEDVPN